MAPLNYVTKVAIVGASGNIGKFITENLLKTGKHTVTAITRFDSQSTFPESVIVKRVDYDKPEMLAEALHGQEALVITLSGRAPLGPTEEKLVRAAGEAGVRWILPNEWSPDSANESLVRDLPMLEKKVTTRKLIESLGQSSYISIVTGFWYEMSLSRPQQYGFHFANRTVTLFDDGEVKSSTTTLQQIGRAVAALLSLPIDSPSSTTPSLSSFANSVIYLRSFTLSQKDILASATRVTSTLPSEWTITHESSAERFAAGQRAAAERDMANLIKTFTRVWFPDGAGDFENGKGTINAVLGLTEEDLDEATREAMKIQQEAGAGFGY